MMKAVEGADLEGEDKEFGFGRIEFEMLISL